MTPDEAKRVRFQGRTMAAQILINMRQGGHALDHVESFGAGFIEGVRDFLIANRDEATAYAAIQQVADEIPHPLLSEKPELG